MCNDGSCCSEFGWCGTSSAHCSGSSTEVPTCGGGSVGNGMCAGGSCCSEYGWCGTSSAHCSGSTGGGGGGGGGAFSITSPAQSLSVADIQAGLNRYNQLQGGNRVANQGLVNEINTVTQGYSLYRQLAFIAQTIWESGGFQYTEEVAATIAPFSTRDAYQDCDWNTPGLQLPNNGKYYYGRGYMQLSWCANYKAYGSARNVDGDPDYFLNNPELVATIYAMDSAAWFFESEVTDDSGQFGSTTRDINGAIECSASYIGNTPQKRYQIFDALAQAVGLTGYNTNGC
jgi:chitinase